MLIFSVFAYVGIAALFFNMSLKEHQSNGVRSLRSLVLSALACAAWPVVAVLLLLAVNLTSDRANKTV